MSPPGGPRTRPRCSTCCCRWGVDLVVLNRAPLELAGRIALHGQLLFDDDPPARVRWVATTRKIYADEQPRLHRSHREFAQSVRRGR